MPQLLEDLAEETSASNRRAADRLDAEARELDRLRRAADALEGPRQEAVESAWQATDYVVSRLPQVEGLYRLALAELCKRPTGEYVDRLLRALLKVFESGRGLVRSSRSLWGEAEQMGAAPKRLDELDGAERLFEELAAEAQQALEHHAQQWQPADPERLAQGLQLAREGKTVKADEARAWFRRPLP